MRAVRMPSLLKLDRNGAGSLPKARSRVNPEILESRKKPSAIVHEALPQDGKSDRRPAKRYTFFIIPP